MDEGTLSLLEKPGRGKRYSLGGLDPVDPILKPLSLSQEKGRYSRLRT